MGEKIEYVTVYYVEDGQLVQRMTTYGEQLIKERIVRCKDCKHYGERGMRGWQTEKSLGVSCVCEREEYVAEVQPNGFCAWGVPKHG